MYEVYQASCFGWIVDAVTSRTVAFGGDPLYVGMKNTYLAQLKSQTTDYGSMIHQQYMLKQQGGVGPTKGLVLSKHVRLVQIFLNIFKHTVEGGFLG